MSFGKHERTFPIHDNDTPLRPEEKVLVDGRMKKLAETLLNFPTSGADSLEPSFPRAPTAPMEIARPNISVALADFVSGTQFRMKVFDGKEVFIDGESTYAPNKIEFEVLAWGNQGRISPDKSVLAVTSGQNNIREIPRMEFAIIGASEMEVTNPQHKGVIKQFSDLVVQPLTIRALTEEDLKAQGTSRFDELINRGEIVYSESGRYFRREWEDRIVVPPVVSLEYKAPLPGSEYELIFSETVTRPQDK